ncbi:hypothetical protein BKI52_02625 [marine bacterium AO1-C]|nr:hypothetical protein BKI52_02625 [marine bacterium AO1-C]
MITRVPISNSRTILTPPIYREVEARIEPIYSEFDLRRVDIVCRIYQFTDEAKTQRFALLPHYQKTLQITKTTIVDKRNGNYVDVSLPVGHPEYVPKEFRIDELTHFMNQKNASIQEALGKGILRADAMNKFDQLINQ